MNSRHSRPLLTVMATATLLAAGIGAKPALAEPTPAATVTTDLPNAAPRSNGAEALAAARASGERVEDLSQRTPDRQVFAEPDGTWTAEITSGPVRAKNASGDWAPIDTDLIEHDGRLQPKNAPGDVTFSNGGDRAFAAAAPENTSTAEDHLIWRWPAALPEPEIDGPTATYKDAVPGGGDLVVTATPDGFTHNVVLNQRPETNDGDLQFAVPVITPDAELRQTNSGALEIVSDQGESLATAPPPIMWDSSGTDTRDPSVAAVTTSVVDTSTGASIVLEPDMDFLADPDTQYPVVVDPAFSIFTVADTFVDDSSYSASQASSPELRVGSNNAGATKARAFLKFNGDLTWDNAIINSATMTLRNFASGTCVASSIQAARITEAWNSVNVTWAHQPSATTSGQAYYAPAAGAEGCASANASWNVTNIVQAWASGAANNGIRLAAVNENSSNTYRRYRSAEYTDYDGAFKPKLTVSYNRYPSVTYAPSAAPLAASTPAGATQPVYTTSTRTPSVSAKASDPDSGDQVRISLRAYAAADLNSELLGQCTTPWGATDVALACTMPKLPNQSTIYLRAKAQDSHEAWAGQTYMNNAGWSAWRAITVDAPIDPVVAQIMTLEPWNTEDDVLAMIQELIDQSAAAGSTYTFDEAKAELLKGYQPSIDGCSMSAEVEFDAIDTSPSDPPAQTDPAGDPSADPSAEPTDGAVCLDATSDPVDSAQSPPWEDPEFTDGEEAAPAQGLEPDVVSSAEAASSLPMLRMSRSHSAHRGVTKWGTYTLDVQYLDNGTIRTFFNWQAAPWLVAGATTPAAINVARTPAKPTVCNYHKPAVVVGYNWHWKCWTTPNRTYGVRGSAVFSGVYGGILYRVTTRIAHLYRVGP